MVRLGRWTSCLVLVAAAMAVIALAGCGQSSSVGGSESATSANPTFSKHIAPIVFAHCADCHRAGESAPFHLLTYQDVAQHAEQIVEVIQSRFMPPWLPEPGRGEFADARRLSDTEIATIEAWVGGGKPEGDPSDLPPQPEWKEGWQLGEPDLVVELTEPYTLQADGTDVFRNFVLPVSVSSTKYVRAVEIRPRNRPAVHHALMRVDRSHFTRRMDEGDPGPGFGGMSMGSAELPGGHLIGWLPGRQPVKGFDEIAWRLEPGMDLVLQLHMLPTGKPEPIQPSVGLFFAEQPPTRQAYNLSLGTSEIDILPGTKEYVLKDKFVLPVDVEVLAVQPHAHFLGKEMKGTATLPDGSTQWLLHIKDWDFNWQDGYRYAERLFLPKGTTLDIEFTFDNSADNPRNPHRPPKRVTFGYESSDEMCEFHLQVVPRRVEDLAVLKNLHERKFIFKLDQYLQQVLADPDNVEKRTKLATALAISGQMREALAHFRTALDIDPDFPEAHINLGLLMLQQGRPKVAVRHLKRAVELKPDSVDALLNLGVAYGRLKNLAEAVERLQQALAINPDFAATHLNLGLFLSRQGEIDRATEHLERAIEIEPNLVEAHFALGSVYRKQNDLERAAGRFQHVLEMRPGFAPAHYELGRLFAEQEKLAEAAAQFEQVVSRQPNNWEAHFQLAQVLDNQGQHSGAATHYERILAARPDQFSVQYRLALVRERLGQHEQALAHLRTARSSNPTSLRFTRALAWLLATSFDDRVRDGKQALKWARQCAEASDHGQPEALETLAGAYAEVGDFDQAVKWQTRAIELLAAEKKDEGRARLKLYEAGQPYRQPPPK